MAIFPGERGLASFIGAKDDESGGDNWSYKTCKDPLKSSSPTNQHPTFYRLDVLPVTQSTVSKHSREIITFYRLLNFSSSGALPSMSLTTNVQRLLVTSEEGCHATLISPLMPVQYYAFLAGNYHQHILQCFDTAGWATGRAPGCKNSCSSKYQGFSEGLGHHHHYYYYYYLRSRMPPFMRQC